MSGWYRVAWPLLRRLPPETAHRLALRALVAGDGFAHVADALGVNTG